MIKRKIPKFLCGIAGTLLAITAWELVGITGLVNREFVPSFFTILTGLITNLAGGGLTAALGSTVYASAVGCGIAIVLGVPLGILVGRSSVMDQATWLIIEFMRPIPSVAFVPIAIIILGLGFKTEVLVVSFASFWMVLFNTRSGVEDIDPRLIDSAKVLRISRYKRLFFVIIPSALPSILTGIRLASSTALVVAISAEILISSSGLGFYLETARLGGNTNIVWVGAFAAGIIGYLINIILLKGEKWFLPWSMEFRNGI